MFGLILFLLAVPQFATLSAQNERTGYYINRTGLDLLTGESGSSIRLQMTHGYQFTEQLSAGIGAGYVFYRDPADLVPIFIDLVYQLGNERVSPFLQFKFGSSISVLRNRDIEPDRHRGGAFLNPALGFWIKSENGAGIYLSAGFNLDHSTLEMDAFSDRTIRDTVSYRRVSLSFGFIFQ